MLPAIRYQSGSNPAKIRLLRKAVRRDQHALIEREQNRLMRALQLRYGTVSLIIPIGIFNCVRPETLSVNMLNVLSAEIAEVERKEAFYCIMFQTI